MNKFVFLLIMLSILLSSTAQIVLKMGMSNPIVLHAINASSTFNIVRTIATNLYVVGGLTLYFSSAAVWLFVLAKIDVSTAYPFVGIGFILTMLLAFTINGEAMTAAKVAGTLLIAAGVVVIARG